jgi:hypothetical protein
MFLYRSAFRLRASASFWSSTCASTYTASGMGAGSGTGSSGTASGSSNLTSLASGVLRGRPRGRFGSSGFLRGRPRGRFTGAAGVTSGTSQARRPCDLRRDLRRVDLVRDLWRVWRDFLRDLFHVSLSYGGPYRVVGRQGGVDASDQPWSAVHQRRASLLVEIASGHEAQWDCGSDGRCGCACWPPSARSRCTRCAPSRMPCSIPLYSMSGRMNRPAA